MDKQADISQILVRFSVKRQHIFSDYLLIHPSRRLTVQMVKSMNELQFTKSAISPLIMVRF